MEQSEFSKRTLTFEMNNWDDDDYEDFKEKLMSFVKREFNDLSMREKEDNLFIIN